MSEFLLWAGKSAVMFFSAIIKVLIISLFFVFSELFSFFKLVLKSVKWLVNQFLDSFRHRVKVSDELFRQVKSAKNEDEKAYREARYRLIGSFLFGEEGVFYTAFNYILPIVSIAFLVGVIKYGTGLEYGIAVEYNGREIGIISAEADFEEAEREVQQRIAYSSGDETIDLDKSAKFTLKIISENDKFITSVQLANEMLSASDQKITEAYGIYIDGEFVGAVEDRKPVQAALSDRLFNYEVDGIVKDISYVNNVAYNEGLYLIDSVMSESKAIKMLTSSKEKKAVYVVKKDDTAVTVAQKFNMDYDTFEEMNPMIKKKCTPGMIVNVIEHESYLPIQYIREMETTSFLDYETIKVETSSLNVGTEKTIVKGERGEKKSNIEITYIDGIEASRKTVKTKITKEPIVEQIGVGIYSAQPDAPFTVYMGYPLTGSGQFAWPVDGGWISDVFGSDRNHIGLDIAAGMSTEIYAAEAGVVVSAGWNSGGYGNVVMIDHLNGYQTVYAHMSYVSIPEGQYVSRGQLIGLVGSTGDSSGPHCHFEVRYEGVRYDPALFMNTAN